MSVCSCQVVLLQLNVRKEYRINVRGHLPAGVVVGGSGTVSNCKHQARNVDKTTELSKYIVHGSKNGLF